MTKHRASPSEQHQQAGGNTSVEVGVSEQDLVGTFNTLRVELIATLGYVLRNQDDALDVAQEAFLKCWRHRKNLDDVSNLRAWIFRVALNSAKDFQRSAWNRKAKPMLPEELMPHLQDRPAGAALEDQEAMEQLRLAIQDLRPDEQEVFLLRQNGELTYEQIAEIRHVPVGTVKTQMRAALMKLRAVLQSTETQPS